MPRSRYLIIAGFLMISLGLARGAGGLVLLTQGAAADPNIQATDTAVSTAGVVLLLLGLALIVAAIGVFRRLRPFWLVGLVCTVSFVVDGAINGFVLYGSPRDKGTIVNVVAAALILACLLLGRSALRNRAVQR
ncbi:hypothetical protein H8E07_20935 [bacterium]|nr:hypothetical protein [bacterium]